MKIRFHILKIGWEHILDDSVAYGVVDIKDNQDYDSEEKFESLRKHVANIYDAPVEDIMTELECQYKLLEIAQSKRDLMEQEYEQKKNRTQRDTVVKIQLLNWKSNSNKELGNRKRKITKLKKNYDRQGLWRPELD